ncbi:MAG: DUF6240 domain-containing protein [Lachnospiraceae bacterium]
MQIDQIEKKGIFRQAQISGGQENDLPVRETQQKQEKRADVVTGSVPVTQTVTYAKPEQEQNTAFSEIKNCAAAKDAVQMKNEMIVGANTSTPESGRALEEDGFSLPDTDIHTVVTETDKIQMQLAKAGKDTSYFSGELSAEQIEQIAGSAALAAQYESAIQQANAIQPLSEGALKYMLDNELEPTIGNIYRAQYNGTYAYVEQPDSELDQTQITEQIEKVIAAAGMELSEQNIYACKWLAANDISVTTEHLSSLRSLQELQLPVDQENLFHAMQTAVSEEKTPADAYLVDSASLIARAEDAAGVLAQTTDRELAYLIEQGQELTIANLREAHHLIESRAVNGEESWAGADEETLKAAFSDKGLALLEARRMLEETRLVMTTEANYGLLKRGMEIEIKPLVQLVEELKTQEQDYYRQLLEADGSEATPDQIACFKQAIETAEQLRFMPAAALGSRMFDGTTAGLYEAGTQLQAKMEAAGEAYETLMTAPRADMGDSIQKAFRNVDDILQEIGMEATASNARAVRILAYNQMEINEQSVLEMKLADRQVQEAFNSLKPAVVREMIREGINPLQMQLSELNEQAEQIRTQIGGSDEMTKFSEYLWKLEQNHEISAQERDSYIGIYRLIHQVETGDGAAIGALVQQGAPLTMGNLLSAVRSGKKSGMDYKVDDRFGGVDGSFRGSSITDQINAAYQTQCVKAVQQIAQEPEQFADLLSNENWKEMTPEQLMEQLQQPKDQAMDEAYNRELWQELNRAAAAQTEVYEMLETYQMPATVNNVLAMQQMMANPNDALRRFFKLTERIENEDKKADLMAEIAQIKEEILHKLGENIQAPEELARAQETLAEVAEHCGQTVMYEGMTRLDIRQLQMMTTQLHLGASMAREERYQIPILTSDGAVGVNVRIVRGSEKKGSVRLTMESATYGKVAAELHAEEKGIRGYLASDSRAGADRLRQEQPRVEELLTELGGETAENEIRVIFSEHLDLMRFELAGGKSGQPADEAQREIQTKELYTIAEKLIRFFREGITKEA